MIALSTQASNAQVALMAAVQHESGRTYTTAAYTITITASEFLEWLNANSED